MSNPYHKQGRHQFWKTVAPEWAGAPDISRLYRRKFDIGIAEGARIATAGSCFARNIRGGLLARNCNFFDVEPPPAMLPPERHAEFKFSMFSARYGNIYTAAQLRQLAERAIDGRVFEDTVWETDGRFYDAFRPTVEPNGFASAEEVGYSRDSHLRAVRKLFTEADVLIFTLGLTEAWRARADGLVYSMSPGTVAGTFDPEKHEFVNFGAAEVVADFEAFMKIVGRVNPNIRYILTVAPGPTLATGTDQHVINANSYSKAVLRVAAGELYARHDGVDYFPSYEIFSSPLSRGRFYAANGHSPTPEGIRLVMKMFFAEHGKGSVEMLARCEDPEARAVRMKVEAVMARMREICDEMLQAAQQREV